MVVTDNPPHKRYTDVSPIEDRVILVEKAITGTLLSRYPV
jgi:hypothetical protein